MRLTRYIFSTQVGHVQRVSLVPDRTHNMRTLSLKPLLFGEFQFWVQLINSEVYDRKWTHEHILYGLISLKNIVQGSSIIYNIMNTLRYLFKHPLCPAI